MTDMRSKAVAFEISPSYSKAVEMFPKGKYSMKRWVANLFFSAFQAIYLRLLSILNFLSSIVEVFSDSSHFALHERRGSPYSCESAECERVSQIGSKVLSEYLSTLSSQWVKTIFHPFVHSQRPKPSVKTIVSMRIISDNANRSISFSR